MIDILFDYTSFITRGCCGQWTPFFKNLYIFSNCAIFSACFATVVSLIWVKSNFIKMLEGKPLRVLFSLFILFCGIGHLEGYISFQYPMYNLFACWDFLTAIISWATVFVLLFSEHSKE